MLCYMSRYVPLRIPDDLAERIDFRSVLRKANRTQVILELIRAGLAADDALEQPTEQPRRNPLSIPGVFLGSQLGAPEPVAERPTPMCPYTEFDAQDGEYYKCRLPVHGPKVKHQRGERVT